MNHRDSHLVRTAWLAAVFALAAAPFASPNPGTERGNVLLIVADDLGIEHVDAYRAGPPATQPPTPTLDALAASGVLFQNAWSAPTCSPTRTMLMTGRYPWRTGVGRNVGKTPPFRMGDDETTLFELLRPAGVTTLLIGKWHVGRRSPFLDPAIHGLDLFLGTQSNPGDYWSFKQQLVIPWQAITYPPVTYSTTELTDHAIGAMAVLPEPWFVIVSYHAPHKPFHVPPANLHGYGNPVTDADKYLAMVEALDTELGRLLGATDLSRTTVMFCGDNGSPSEVSPYGNSAKGSLMEPGIRVPLMVAGQAVMGAPRDSEALVSLADVFATVASLYGVESAAEDSVSFHPILDSRLSGAPRETVFSEKFAPNGFGPYQNHQRAARDHRHKLIRDERTGSEQLFDLHTAERGTDGPPLDLQSLTPEQNQAYQKLRQVILNGG